MLLLLACWMATAVGGVAVAVPTPPSAMSGARQASPPPTSPPPRTSPVAVQYRRGTGFPPLSAARAPPPSVLLGRPPLALRDAVNNDIPCRPPPHGGTRVVSSGRWDAGWVGLCSGGSAVPAIAHQCMPPPPPPTRTSAPRDRPRWSATGSSAPPPTTRIPTPLAIPPTYRGKAPPLGSGARGNSRRALLAGGQRATTRRAPRHTPRGAPWRQPPLGCYEDCI